MIYEFIKEKLQALEGLEAKVYPVSVNIDDVDGAFAIYSFRSSDPSDDLSGAVHHYTDLVDVDFVGPYYDEIYALYWKAIQRLTVSNLDTEKGEYIFSSRCSSQDPDAFDLNHGLFRRSLRVRIDWCFMEEVFQEL